MPAVHSGRSSKETDALTWKCPYCGAENEGSSLYCDGCGDKRPKTLTTPVFPKAGKASVDEEPTEEPLEAEGDDWEKPQESKVEKGKLQEAEEIEEPEEAEAEEDEGEDELQIPELQIPEPVIAAEPALPAPQTTGQRFYLVFVNTPAQSLIKSKVSIEFDLFPVISIGRNPENIVVVPDQEVSRKHAQLTIEGTRVMLKDLKSSNGTFVYDGKEFQRVTDSVEVKPNTVIKFGTSTIVRLARE